MENKYDKWYGLFYQAHYEKETLYGISNNLNKLEQKKKDLSVLYDIALTYNQTISKKLCNLYDLRAMNSITSLEYIAKQSVLQYDDNAKYADLEIREIKVL